MIGTPGLSYEADSDRTSRISEPWRIELLRAAWCHNWQMRYLPLFLLLVTFLALAQTVYQGKVVRVIDGDTLSLLAAGQKIGYGPFLEHGVDEYNSYRLGT